MGPAQQAESHEETTPVESTPLPTTGSPCSLPGMENGLTLSACLCQRPDMDFQLPCQPPPWQATISRDPRWTSTSAPTPATTLLGDCCRGGRQCPPQRHICQAPQSWFQLYPEIPIPPAPKCFDSLWRARQRCSRTTEDLARLLCFNWMWPWRPAGRATSALQLHRHGQLQTSWWRLPSRFTDTFGLGNFPPKMQSWQGSWTRPSGSRAMPICCPMDVTPAFAFVPQDIIVLGGAHPLQRRDSLWGFQRERSHQPSHLLQRNPGFITCGESFSQYLSQAHTGLSP